jgi:hypothetical protein
MREMENTEHWMNRRTHIAYFLAMSSTQPCVIDTASARGGGESGS